LMTSQASYGICALIQRRSIPSDLEVCSRAPSFIADGIARRIEGRDRSHTRNRARHATRSRCERSENGLFATCKRTFRNIKIQCLRAQADVNNVTTSLFISAVKTL